MKTHDKTFPSFHLIPKYSYWILSVCLAIILIAAWRYTPNTFDDAYNYLRYARNFLNGHGQSYNPSEGQIYGLTSQMYFYYHLLIVVLFPLSESIVMEISSGIMGLLSFLALGYFSLRTLNTTSIEVQIKWIFVSLLMLLALSKSYVFHWYTGMDTTMSILMNTLLIGTIIGTKENADFKRILLVSLLSFFCVFTRPDNLIYATLLPGLYFTTQFKSRQRWPFLAIFIIGFGALMLSDLAIKFLLFGQILPTTWNVKQNGFFEGYTLEGLWNAMEYFIHFITLMTPFLILMILTFNRQVIPMLASIFAPVILTFSYYFFVFQIMGFESRYYLPAIPFFIIGSIVCVNNLFKEKNIQWSVHLLSPFRFICLFILFTLIANGSVISSKYENLYLDQGPIYYPNIEYTTDASEDLKRTDWLYHIENIRSLAQSLPTGCKLATTETGRMSAIGIHIHLIDLIGFHNIDITRGGFNSSDLMDKEPDIIFIHHVYSKMNKDILENDTFQSNYEYYPEAFFGGIAIHKRSPIYHEVKSAINQTWKKAYPQQDMKNYMATFKDNAAPMKP